MVWKFKKTALFLSRSEEKEEEVYCDTSSLRLKLGRIGYKHHFFKHCHFSTEKQPNVSTPTISFYSVGRGGEKEKAGRARGPQEDGGEKDT